MCRPNPRHLKTMGGHAGRVANVSGKTGLAVGSFGIALFFGPWH